MINRSKLITGAIFALLSLSGADALLAESITTFTGGGVIRDGHGTDAHKVTFSVDMYAEEPGPAAGFLQINFHDIGDPYGLDKSRFTASEFSQFYVDSRDFEAPGDHYFIRIVAEGRLDGEDGWSVLVRFTDHGTPGLSRQHSEDFRDTVRIMLFDPDPLHVEAVYDTALDYPRDESWRTLLDGGNVTVNISFSSGSP